MRTQKMISGLLAAALSLAAGYAFACPPEQAEHCDVKQHGKMSPVEMHWKKMHDALKLSPEQESAWKTMQMHNRERMEKHLKEMNEVIAQTKDLPAPERMEQRNAMMERHQKERAEGLAEFKVFYGQLSAEQKKTLDSQTGMHEGMEMHRDGEHGKPHDVPKK